MSEKTETSVQVFHLAHRGVDAEKCVICGQTSIMSLNYKGRRSFACSDHLAEAEALVRVSTDFFAGPTF